MTTCTKIFWLTIATFSCAAVLWLRGENLMPPRQHKAAKGVTQGAGAEDLLRKAKPQSVRMRSAAPGARQLAWDWAPNAGNPASNVVFLIRSGSLLSQRTNWPIVAISTSNGWPLTISQTAPPTFYSVQASNRVTHLTAP